MQAVVGVALPIFGVILCGFFARLRGVFGPSAVKTLNDFVFIFALPVLLMINVADAEIEELFDWRLAAIYYLPVAVIFIITILFGLLYYRNRIAPATIQGLCAIWSNSGHLGIPLTIFAFGADNILPTVLVLTFDNIVLAPIAFALMESDRAVIDRRAVLQIGRRLVTNPVVLGVGAGVVLSATSIEMPLPVHAFGELLGSGAAPCALFALGAALVGVPLGTARTEIAVLAGLKLVLHPSLVLLLGTFVIPVDPVALGVIAVVAALPTGTSVFVFAQRYEAYVQRASTAIFASHVAAVLTVTLFLAAVGVHP